MLRRTRGRKSRRRADDDVAGRRLADDGVDAPARVSAARGSRGLFPTKCPSNLKRTVAYVDQSDLTLTPILTVEETVRFARSCAEELDPYVLEGSMDAIFKLTGLDPVRRTVVGNADIRGVSGGQKRRVKMLEMAVGRGDGRHG